MRKRKSPPYLPFYRIRRAWTRSEEEAHDYDDVLVIIAALRVIRSKLNGSKRESADLTRLIEQALGDVFQCGFEHGVEFASRPKEYFDPETIEKTAEDEGITLREACRRHGTNYEAFRKLRSRRRKKYNLCRELADNWRRTAHSALPASSIPTFDIGDPETWPSGLLRGVNEEEQRRFEEILERSFFE